MAARILIVEDDPDCLQLVQFGLEQAGYLVLPATSAASAVRWLQEPGAKPDLAILDIGLPGKEDGLALCKAIKKDASTRKIPVMILTGYSTNTHRLQAAAAGADLILHKPIKTDELLASARMLMTMPRPERRGLLHRASLEIDPDRHTVFFDGKIIGGLGERLFDLFYVLVEHSPRPLSRRFILATLKVKDRDDQVAVMVSRLRARLRAEFGADLIATVPGEGYRLDLPAVPAVRPP